jgi:hypothetical protein
MYKNAEPLFHANTKKFSKRKKQRRYFGLLSLLSLRLAVEQYLAMITKNTTKMITRITITQVKLKTGVFGVGDVVGVALDVSVEDGVTMELRWEWGLAII